MPTKLIYEAWKGTPRPLEITDAKDNTKVVALAEPEDLKGFAPQHEGDCYICGRPMTGGTSKKAMLSDTFTDGDRAKSPESTHICKACVFCMGTSPIGRAAIRFYPLVADRTLRLVSRKTLRDVIIEPPEPPFVILLPTSQKKHLAYKAQVAYRRDVFPVSLEEEVVMIRRAEFVDMITYMEALRGVGFGVREIEAAAPRHDRVKEFAPEFLTALTDALLQYRKSRQYDIAVTVCGSMDKEEAICYLDSRHRTNIMRQPHR